MSLSNGLGMTEEVFRFTVFKNKPHKKSKYANILIVNFPIAIDISFQDNSIRVNKRRKQSFGKIKKGGEKMAEAKKTGSGLEPNVAALLAYLLGIIGGIVFILIEKENKFVRFAAMQSIFLSVAMFIIWFVLMFLIPTLAIATGGFAAILALLIPLVWLGFLIIWIMLMVKAYQNQEWELPIIGKMAKKYV